MSYPYTYNDNQKNNFHYAHNQLSASNPFNTLNSYNMHQPKPEQLSQKILPPTTNNYNNNNMNKSPSQLYKQQASYLNSFSNNSLYNNSSSPFLSNQNPTSTINYQDKQNYYGQNKDDMTFKRTLRRTPVSNPIQANSYNILNNLPNAKPSLYNTIPNGVGTYRYYNYSQNKDHVGALLGNSKTYPYEYPNYASTRTPISYQQAVNVNNNSNIGNNTNNELNSYGQSTNDFSNNTNHENNKNTYNNANNVPPSRQNNNNINSVNNNIQKSTNEIESIDSPEYYQPNCNLIKEFAYKEDSNSRFRGYMEDKGKSYANFNNNPNNALFCLFDGHGGLDVSKYLQTNFGEEFRKVLPSQNLENTLITLFQDVDEKIKSSNFYNVGSTGCVVYITMENGKRILYCANIGDTRCTLVSSYKATRISYDDKATDTNEYNRIINSGGIIFAGRVYGQLMLSRSFGDWELKPYGVINVPHVKRVPIEEFDKYIIIASDGVWDVLEDEDVYKLGMENNNGSADELCKNIIKTALLRGTMDNLSCFVIKL